MVFISANNQVRVRKTLRDEKEKNAGHKIASRPDVRLQVADAATVAVGVGVSVRVSEGR